jgi:hypothetical protein
MTENLAPDRFIVPAPNDMGYCWSDDSHGETKVRGENLSQLRLSPTNLSYSIQEFNPGLRSADSTSNCLRYGMSC